MSYMYTATGEIVLKDSPEVLEILDTLRREARAEIDIIRIGMDEIQAELSINGTFSAGHIGDIDVLLRSLAPYAPKGGVIETRFEDTYAAQIFLGDDKTRRKMTSQRALEKIRQLIPDLTVDDLGILEEEMKG